MAATSAATSLVLHKIFPFMLLVSVLGAFLWADLVMPRIPSEMLLEGGMSGKDSNSAGLKRFSTSVLVLRPPGSWSAANLRRVELMLAAVWLARRAKSAFSSSLKPAAASSTA
eukprot:jgi/Botrbrau1/22657/Bobra.0132s0003.1